MESKSLFLAICSPAIFDTSGCFCGLGIEAMLTNALKLFYVIPVSFIILYACSRAQQKASLTQTLPDEVVVQKIVNLFEKMPHSCTPEGSPSAATRREIVRQMGEVVIKYDVSSIRTAIIKYMNNKPVTSPKYASATCNIFLFNRLLFNTPNNASLKTPIFGGWMGPIDNVDSRNMMWPLVRNQNGDIDDYETFGGYMGSPYAFIEEFDYFNTTYGLRKKSQQ
jgi:hypothetical protein